MGLSTPPSLHARKGDGLCMLTPLALEFVLHSYWPKLELTRPLFHHSIFHFKA